jgi:hypothetical protein
MYVHLRIAKSVTPSDSLVQPCERNSGCRDPHATLSYVIHTCRVLQWHTFAYVNVFNVVVSSVTFSTKSRDKFTFVVSVKQPTCPANLLFLDLITLLIFLEEHKLLISSLCPFVRFYSVFDIILAYLCGFFKLQLRALILLISFNGPSSLKDYLKVYTKY